MKYLKRLNTWAQKRTGLVWGYVRISARIKTTSGYPLHKALLVVCPPAESPYGGRFAGSVSVRSHLVYIGRAP